MKRKCHWNRKHFIGLLLAACMTLTLAGCGEEPGDPTVYTRDPDENQQSILKTTAPDEDTTTEPADVYAADEEHEVAIGELRAFLDTWYLEHQELDPPPSCEVTVTGLCTPVVLEMDELMVNRVRIWDRTVVVDAGVDEGSINFSIGDSGEELVYINGHYESWLVTEGETFHYPYEHEVHTWFRLNDAGALEYRITAMAFYYMEQWDTAPLDSATDRGNLYEERGTVTLTDGQPELTMTARSLMGDVYDFDALFKQARKQDPDYREDCANADEVLAQNKEAGGDWLTYPWEG